MPSEVLTAIYLLIVTTLWMALRHAIAVHQGMKQRRIATSGAVCQGRVVSIQRPFLLDGCTRLYFDYQPDGTTQEIRACHVDRRTLDEQRASLPAQGTLVTIRYLPNHPRDAVIGKLIS